MQPVAKSNSLGLEVLCKPELDISFLTVNSKARQADVSGSTQADCQIMISREVDIHIPVALVGGRSAPHSSGKSPNIETHSRMRSSLFGIKLSKGGYPTISSNIFAICQWKP